MEDQSFMDSLRESWNNVADGIAEYTPKVLMALLLLLIGVVIGKYVSKWLAKLVRSVQNSRAVKSTVDKLDVKQIELDGIVRLFAYWTILLIFFSAAVDILGVAVLTDTFNSLIDFVPNLLAATVIAALSFIAANVLHDIVGESARKAGVSAHKFLAVASKVVVLVFGLPLAAVQLGLDLTILTNNLTVIVAGVMLAFGLAFGLGGRDMAAKMLEDTYRSWKK